MQCQSENVNCFVFESQNLTCRFGFPVHSQSRKMTANLKRQKLKIESTLFFPAAGSSLSHLSFALLSDAELLNAAKNSRQDIENLPSGLIFGLFFASL